MITPCPSRACRGIFASNNTCPYLRSSKPLRPVWELPTHDIRKRRMLAPV